MNVGTMKDPEEEKEKVSEERKGDEESVIGGPALPATTVPSVAATTISTLPPITTTMTPMTTTESTSIDTTTTAGQVTTTIIAVDVDNVHTPSVVLVSFIFLTFVDAFYWTFELEIIF